MKNKRGDKIISVYWFAILFIVAGAVVYMVAIFYGAPYDIREAEANILINKVAGCLSDKGKLIDSVGSLKDNFLEKCNLNFETEDVYDWKEQGQYYLEAEVSGFTDGVLVLNVAEGNFNLKGYCDKEGKSLPVCVEREFYILDESGKQYKIKILGIVRKTEKNAT